MMFPSNSTVNYSQGASPSRASLIFSCLAYIIVSYPRSTEKDNTVNTAWLGLQYSTKLLGELKLACRRSERLLNTTWASVATGCALVSRITRQQKKERSKK